MKGFSFIIKIYWLLKIILSREWEIFDFDEKKE